MRAKTLFLYYVHINTDVRNHSTARLHDTPISTNQTNPALTVPLSARCVLTRCSGQSSWCSASLQPCSRCPQPAGQLMTSHRSPDTAGDCAQRLSLTQCSQCRWRPEEPAGMSIPPSRAAQSPAEEEEEGRGGGVSLWSNMKLS